MPLTRDKVKASLSVFSTVADAFGVKWQQLIRLGIKRLRHLLRNGWLHTISDIVTIHDYGTTGTDFLKYYGEQEADAQALIQRYDDITTAIQKVQRISGYCYTQVTDVQQEVNGLMDIKRNFKADPKQIREINQKRN